MTKVIKDENNCEKYCKVTDEQIMISVKQGSIDQAAILFERYHVGVYNYFLQANRDQSLSEDLTQNVFERMIKYRNSFKTDSRFKGWIFTIARNVKMDHYRSQKIKMDEITDQVDTALEDGEEGKMVALENATRLKKAIDMLEASYKEVLLLTRFEGLKYKEVAEILDCTENTVKSKVRRAIIKLKTIYLQIN